MLKERLVEHKSELLRRFVDHLLCVIATKDHGLGGFCLEVRGPNTFRSEIDVGAEIKRRIDAFIRQEQLGND